MSNPSEDSGRTAKRQKPLFEVVLIVAARIAGALAAIVFTMLLSRSMGATSMGQVSVAISLAMVLALACTTNIEAGGVRFLVADLAQGKFSRARGYLRFSRRYVLAASALTMVGALAFLSLRGGQLPEPHLLLALAAAPLLGWMRLGAGFAMGLSRPVLAVLPRTMFRPVIFMLLIAGWIAVAGPPTPVQAMLLFCLSILGVLVLQQRLLARGAEAALSEAPNTAADLSPWRDWVKIGLTLGLNVLFVEYSIYIAVLCGALVLAANEIALLDISLKLMALLKFGVTAVNQVFMPRLSRAMATENSPALRRWLALSGLMKLAVVLVGLAAAAMLGRWVLSLFGEEFPAAYPLLLLLLLDPVLVVLFGPGANVVSFSKRPHALLPALAVTLTVLVGGIAWLGSAYGLIGAGVAIVAARFVWVLWLAAYCWLKLGVDPSIAAVPRWLFSRSK